MLFLQQQQLEFMNLLEAQPSRLYSQIMKQTLGIIIIILSLFTIILLNNLSFRFVELPGELSYSKLCFFSKFAGGLSQSFGWLTGPGVYYGDLIFGGQNPGDSLFEVFILHFLFFIFLFFF